MVALTWHACKDKVNKLNQRYIIKPTLNTNKQAGWTMGIDRQSYTNTQGTKNAEKKMSNRNMDKNKQDMLWAATMGHQKFFPEDNWSFTEGLWHILMNNWMLTKNDCNFSFEWDCSLQIHCNRNSNN